MLGRLLIRQRLVLLVLLPISIVPLVTVPFLTDRLQQAQVAGAGAREAGSARELGDLVEDLTLERVLSLAYLLTPDAGAGTPMDQLAAIADDTADVRASYGGRLPAAMASAIAGLTSLNPVRTGVENRSTTPDAVESAYDTAIDNLIDALDLTGTQAPTVEVGHEFRALDALMRADEEDNRAASDAMGVILAHDASDAERMRATEAVDVAAESEQQQVAMFRQEAAPGQAALFDVVADGAAAKRVDAFREQVDQPMTMSSYGAAHDAMGTEICAAVETESGLRQLVQDRIAQDTLVQATASASRARWTAYLFGALAVLLSAAAIGLSVAIGRSIARPLRQLTAAASRVADLADAELARVADEDDAEETVPTLVPISLDSRDELGELAGSVNRVQGAAALLLERQIAGRRNIAAMFGSVGRRTQNLVGLQVDLIDRLERDEDDTDVLARLYRLDHLTARLRRHADSLLVLSGRSDQPVAGASVPLSAIVRSALAGVEDFSRIRLTVTDDERVLPVAVTGLVMVAAELLDNAARFSPPTETVEVAIELTEQGCQLRIADHGVGMPEGRLAEENERLLHRERLDLVPTDVLGLFVVGRLCRRLGLRVTLAATPAGGVTAQLAVPSALLAPDSGTDQPAPRHPGVRTAVPAQPGPPASAVPVGSPLAPAVLPPSRPTLVRSAPEPPPATRNSIAQVRHRIDAGTGARAGTGVGRGRARPAFHWFAPLPAPPAATGPNPYEAAPPPGLSRRVPGSHLPPDLVLPVAAAVPGPGLAPLPPIVPRSRADAAAVRSMVLDFEAGIARAQAVGREPLSAAQHPQE